MRFREDREGGACRNRNAGVSSSGGPPALHPISPRTPTATSGTTGENPDRPHRQSPQRTPVALVRSSRTTKLRDRPSRGETHLTNRLYTLLETLLEPSAMPALGVIRHTASPWITPGCGSQCLLGTASWANPALQPAQAILHPWSCRAGSRRNDGLNGRGRTFWAQLTQHGNRAILKRAPPNLERDFHRSTRRQALVQATQSLAAKPWPKQQESRSQPREVPCFDADVAPNAPRDLDPASRPSRVPPGSPGERELSALTARPSIDRLAAKSNVSRETLRFAVRPNTGNWSPPLYHMRFGWPPGKTAIRSESVLSRGAGTSNSLRIPRSTHDSGGRWFALTAMWDMTCDLDAGASHSGAATTTTNRVGRGANGGGGVQAGAPRCA
jgi:hypothetical protein